MFDIFNMLKKDENHPVKQVTRETIICLLYTSDAADD